MELTPEHAIERVEAWLAEPTRLYETLAVRGQPGVGKTRLLLDLSARMPQAVYLDLSLFRFDGHHRCGGQAASAAS